MTGLRNFASFCGAMGVALLASSAGALADGYEVAAPAAVDEGRKFTYSFNIGVTSDYVFRGVSQTSNEPALQGGADIGWGILYAGVWASRVDFDNAPRPMRRSTGTAASSRRGTRHSAPSTSTLAPSTTRIPVPIRDLQASGSELFRVEGRL